MQVMVLNLYPFRCNFASVDSRVVLLQQNTYREFTSAFFSASLASLHSTLQLLYFSDKKSNIITPFAFQNTVAIILPADGCVLNCFGLGGPKPYPLTSLSFNLLNFKGHQKVAAHKTVPHLNSEKLNFFKMTSENNIE